MKENIYTIPLNDAFKANDECPFCVLERDAEQHAINFLLGSGASYMEDDIRMETDKAGFCRAHMKKMYDYGNRLGTGLILSTHMKAFTQEMTKQLKDFTPGKSSFTQRLKKVQLDEDDPQTTLGAWFYSKKKDCYVCNHFKNTFHRYLETFFHMYKEDSNFRELVKNSKGFCMQHFIDVIEAGEKKLNDKQKEELYPVIFKLMEENFQRLTDEVTWFTDMFDYRNKGKDWGNSRDSIQRCMQKLGGGYPADPPFQADR